MYVDAKPILCSRGSDETSDDGTRTPDSEESRDRSTVLNVSVATAGVIHSDSAWHSSFVPMLEPGSSGLNCPSGNRNTLSPTVPQPAGISGVVEPRVSLTTKVPASRSTETT